MKKYTDPSIERILKKLDAVLALLEDKPSKRMPQESDSEDKSQSA